MWTRLDKQHLPLTIHRSSEEIDDDRAKLVKKAAVVVGAYVKRAGKDGVTVGELRRTFMEYQDFIWSVLVVLKDNGIVDYGESKPAPTRVYYRPARRITVNHKRYNNQETISRPDPRSTPLPECVFGEKYSRTI